MRPEAYYREAARPGLKIGRFGLKAQWPYLRFVTEAEGRGAIRVQYCVRLSSLAILSRPSGLSQDPSGLQVGLGRQEASGRLVVP